jgi:hypothetical protein
VIEDQRIVVDEVADAGVVATLVLASGGRSQTATSTKMFMTARMVAFVCWPAEIATEESAADYGLSEEVPEASEYEARRRAEA